MKRTDPARLPTRRKSQQRVQDILRASREVFAEKGYEHTTAVEIARRIGVSEATIFSYFRGKRELCSRVIVDWYDEIINAVTTGLPREAPIRQQVAFIVHAHLRLMLENGTGLCALVLSEGRTKTHALSNELNALQRSYTAPLMEVLAHGQKLGQIRNDIPLSLLRSLVFGPMEHVLWDAVLGQRKLDLETTAVHLTDILWTALQPPRPALAALTQFKDEVVEALERFNIVATPQPAPRTRAKKSA